MSFIDIKNTQIHYSTQWKVYPTIFLHGLSDSSQFFTPLISNLTGINTIQPDLRGHGESAKDVEISMELLTTDVRNLLNLLDVKKGKHPRFFNGIFNCPELRTKISRKG